MDPDRQSGEDRLQTAPPGNNNMPSPQDANRRGPPFQQQQQSQQQQQRYMENRNGPPDRRDFRGPPAAARTHSDGAMRMPNLAEAPPPMGYAALVNLPAPMSSPRSHPGQPVPHPAESTRMKHAPPLPHFARGNSEALQRSPPGDTRAGGPAPPVFQMDPMRGRPESFPESSPRNDNARRMDGSASVSQVWNNRGRGGGGRGRGFGRGDLSPMAAGRGPRRMGQDMAADRGPMHTMSAAGQGDRGDWGGRGPMNSMMPHNRGGGRGGGPPESGMMPENRGGGRGSFPPAISRMMPGDRGGRGSLGPPPSMTGGMVQDGTSRGPHMPMHSRMGGGRGGRGGSTSPMFQDGGRGRGFGGPPPPSMNAMSMMMPDAGRGGRGSGPMHGMMGDGGRGGTGGARLLIDPMMNDGGGGNFGRGGRGSRGRGGRRGDFHSGNHGRGRGWEGAGPPNGERAPRQWGPMSPRTSFLQGSVDSGVDAALRRRGSNDGSRSGGHKPPHPQSPAEPPATTTPVASTSPVVVDTKPKSPPPSPPPEPAEASGLILALTRLVDMEEELDFAYARHVILMAKQKKLRAAYEHLEQLPIGLEALEDDLKDFIVQCYKDRAKDRAKEGSSAPAVAGA
jgi:hypothetical protein